MTPGGESIDELRKYQLRIIQPRHGYRFSLDPLLLCDFAAAAPGERAMDLGCGCGIMPLILARQMQDALVTGVECQEMLAELARRNVSLNGLHDRIGIRNGDVMSLKGEYPVSSFDLVLSNPPYRKPGTGRVSPKAGRDLARHESTATLADFLAVAKYLVKPAGRICFIYHPTRLAELCQWAAELKLSLLRLRMIHGNAGAAAGMFMVELAKGRKRDFRCEPPLLVHGADGEYTQEVKDIIG